MADYSFPKEEKLKSKKIIQSVFREGEQFYHYPIKLFFLPLSKYESDTSIQVLVSVSKRNFKKAVTRNKIKRQLREIYRLSKPCLVEKLRNQKGMACIGIVYIAKKQEAYQEINKAYIALINKLNIG